MIKPEIKNNILHLHVVVIEVENPEIFVQELQQEIKHP